MPRQGYDAVTWTEIPADAAIVLGYVDGNWPWPQDAWDHFASLNIPAVRIAVDPSTSADVLDCEPGNPVNPAVNAADAVPWVVSMRNLGKTPCIYCSAANVPWMMAAFVNAGVDQPLYDVCDDTAYPHMWSGNGADVVSTQYNITDPLDYDLVVDYWPGIDPAPVDPPPPVESIPNMTMSTPSVNGVAGLSWSEGSAKNIQLITYSALGEPPQVELDFINVGQGPVEIGNDNWLNGRVVVPMSSIAAADKCCGVIVRAMTSPGTPFWLYSNGS